jgi:hypothetical protein
MESVLEIARAARQIDFDPVSKFRFAFGDTPWDLLNVIEVSRRGFANFIRAQSISPYLNELVFVAFVSAKIAPVVGEFFGFNGEEVSLLRRRHAPTKAAESPFNYRRGIWLFKRRSELRVSRIALCPMSQASCSVRIQIVLLASSRRPQTFLR